jgi:hypothetical protein
MVSSSSRFDHLLPHGALHKIKRGHPPETVMVSSRAPTARSTLIPRGKVPDSSDAVSFTHREASSVKVIE